MSALSTNQKKQKLITKRERRKRIDEVKKVRSQIEKKWKHQNELNVNKSRVSLVSSLHLLRLHVISQSKESRDDKDYEWGGRTQERGLRTRAVKEGRGPQINQSSRLTSNQTHLVSLSVASTQGAFQIIFTLSLFLHKSYAGPLMLK